jgi:hypothetical protein
MARAPTPADRCHLKEIIFWKGIGADDAVAGLSRHHAFDCQQLIAYEEKIEPTTSQNAAVHSARQIELLTFS